MLNAKDFSELLSTQKELVEKLESFKESFDRAINLIGEDLYEKLDFLDEKLESISKFFQRQIEQEKRRIKPTFRFVSISSEKFKVDLSLLKVTNTLLKQINKEITLLKRTSEFQYNILREIQTSINRVSNFINNIINKIREISIKIKSWFDKAAFFRKEKISSRLFKISEKIKEISVESPKIPKEILVKTPKIPKEISVRIPNIPKEISVKAPRIFEKIPMKVYNVSKEIVDLSLLKISNILLKQISKEIISLKQILKLQYDILKKIQISINRIFDFINSIINKLKEISVKIESWSDKILSLKKEKISITTSKIPKEIPIKTPKEILIKTPNIPKELSIKISSILKEIPVKVSNIPKEIFMKISDISKEIKIRNLDISKILRKIETTIENLCKCLTINFREKRKIGLPGEIFEKIKTVLDKIRKEISNIPKEIKIVMKNLCKCLITNFKEKTKKEETEDKKGLLEKIFEKIRTILNKIREGISNLKEKVGSFTVKFKNIFQEFSNKFAKSFGRFSGLIEFALGFLFGLFGIKGLVFGAGAYLFGPMLLSMIGGIGKKLLSLIGIALKESIKWILPKLGSLLRGTASRLLGTTIGRIGTSIVSAIIGIFEGISLTRRRIPGLEGIKGGISKFLGGFLAGTGRGFGNAILNALKLAALFLPVFPPIGPIIGGTLGFVLGFFGGESVARGIYNVLRAAETGIKRVISVAGKIGAFMLRIGGDTFRERLLNGLKWAAMLSFIPPLMPLGFVFGFFGAGRVINFIKTAFDRAKQIVHSAAGIIRRVEERIRERGVLGSVIDALNWINTKIRQFHDWIWNFITWPFRRLFEFLGKIMPIDVRRKVSSIVQRVNLGFLNTFKKTFDFISIVINKIKEVPAKIRTWISKIPVIGRFFGERRKEILAIKTPKIPRKISVEVPRIPKEINVKDSKISKEILIKASNIPKEIKIPKIPEEIKIKIPDVPKEIKAPPIPKEISVKMSKIPKEIPVKISDSSRRIFVKTQRETFVKIPDISKKISVDISNSLREVSNSLIDIHKRFNTSLRITENNLIRNLSNLRMKEIEFPKEMKITNPLIEENLNKSNQTMQESNTILKEIKKILEEQKQLIEEMKRKSEEQLLAGETDNKVFFPLGLEYSS